MPVWALAIAVKSGILFIRSALQAAGLAVHILNHDIVDFAQGGAVFQHLPGFVGMEMNFNQFIVAHHQQAVAGQVLQKVIPDIVLVQVVPFDEELGTRPGSL